MYDPAAPTPSVHLQHTLECPDASHHAPAAAQITPMQIKQQRREWADLYTAFSEAYCGPSPAPDKQTFLWALQCVRSRAFSGPHPGPPIQQRLASGAVLCTLGAAYVIWAHVSKGGVAGEGRGSRPAAAFLHLMPGEERLGGFSYALVSAPFNAQVPLESALNAAIAAALFNLLYDVLLSGRRRWYALLPGVDSINHSSHVEVRAFDPGCPVGPCAPAGWALDPKLQAPAHVFQHRNNHLAPPQSDVAYRVFGDSFELTTGSSFQPGEQVFISYVRGRFGVVEEVGKGHACWSHMAPCGPTFITAIPMRHVPRHHRVFRATTRCCSTM